MVNTRINECGTHMFVLQVYEEAFPLERNLDYVPPAHDQQGPVRGFAKMGEICGNTPLTTGRNWSKSYYGILQHHWRPNPPSKGHCWCPKNNRVHEMTEMWGR